MDKCKAFDVWLDKRLCEMEAIGLDEAFYAGWQSRQAEVEEKDKRIEELEQIINLHLDDRFLNVDWALRGKDQYTEHRSKAE